MNKMHTAVAATSTRGARIVVVIAITVWAIIGCGDKGSEPTLGPSVNTTKPSYSAGGHTSWSSAVRMADGFCTQVQLVQETSGLAVTMQHADQPAECRPNRHTLVYTTTMVLPPSTLVVVN